MVKIVYTNGECVHKNECVHNVKKCVHKQVKMVKIVYTNGECVHKNGLKTAKNGYFYEIVAKNPLFFFMFP